MYVTNGAKTDPWLPLSRLELHFFALYGLMWQYGALHDLVWSCVLYCMDSYDFVSRPWWLCLALLSVLWSLSKSSGKSLQKYLIFFWYCYFVSESQKFKNYFFFYFFDDSCQIFRFQWFWPYFFTWWIVYLSCMIWW